MTSQRYETAGDFGVMSLGSFGSGNLQPSVCGTFPGGGPSSDLHAHVDVGSRLRQLPTSDEDCPFWTDVLERWFLQSPAIAVVGKPSVALCSQMAASKEERLRLRRGVFSPEQLEEHGRRADDARFAMLQAAPPSLFDAYPTPNIAAVPTCEVVSVVLQKGDFECRS